MNTQEDITTDNFENIKQIIKYMMRVQLYVF